MSAQPREAAAPPRDNLIRAAFPADIDVRATDDADKPPILAGHFAMFNEWTRISGWEGEFMERIAPGAFKKTIQENRQNMRVLYDHGHDPQIGNKVLGEIKTLEEDAAGARYEVELHDTSYTKDLLPGLRAGQYGASFRFRVIREAFDEEPGASDHNPYGLPERTIQEAQVMEFGPVTFPAYEGASAGVRSLTDESFTRRYAAGPTTASDGTTTNTSTATTVAEVTTTTEQEPEHSDDPSRATPSPDERPTNATEKEQEMELNQWRTVDEMRERQDEIRAVLKQIASENRAQLLEPIEQSKWDELNDELDELQKRIDADEARQRRLEQIAGDRDAIREPTEGTTYITKRDAPVKAPPNPFAMEEYHQRASSGEHLMKLYRDGARAAVDTFDYPNVDKDAADAQITRMLDDDPMGEVAQRMLIHGSPLYRSAFWKTATHQPLTREESQAFAAGASLEQRALTTAATGGVTVPVQIDPTVLPSSNGSLNPFRLVSRVVQTTSHQWQAVTAADISFTFRAEGAAMADNAPTLVAPAITPERADLFIPFSWEAAQDWTRLETDLGMLIARAKDNAEALKFAVGAGSGSDEPQGVLVGAGTLVGTQTTVVVGTVDLFALFNALGPSFQANATWMTSQAMASRIRQLTSSTTGPGLWADSLRASDPSLLLGRPLYSASSVGTAGAATSPPVASVKWGIIGDFSYFAIVDRVGLQVKMIDNLFSGNTAGGRAYPTGESGLVAYMRTSSGVLASNAFRTGTVT